MPDIKKSKLQLRAGQVPAFPFAPVQYEQKFQDQFQRVLTQYLAQNDNVATNLVGTDGGRYLGFPHIGAHDSTIQYASADNTATVTKWSAVDSGSGFTLNDGTGSAPINSATALYSGIYKIDYSLQFVNSDSQAHIVWVWLQVNTTNVIESASKFTIPSKHGSFNGALVAYSSMTFEMMAGDYVRLYWATDQHATSGGAVGVFMDAQAAQTSPFVMPSIPSAVGTIAFISSIPA